MKPYWRSEHSLLPSLTLTNGLSQFEGYKPRQ